MEAGVHWLSIYVMLSRATTLEGVLLLRLCERADLERAPPQFLLDELDRLAKLEQTSWKALQKALKQCKPHVSQNTWDTIVQSFAQNNSTAKTPGPKESVPRKRPRSPDADKGATSPGTAAGALPTPGTPTPSVTPVRRVRGKTTPDKVKRALDDAGSPGPGKSPPPASCPRPRGQTTPDRIKRALEETPRTGRPETGTSLALCPGPPASGVASGVSQQAADAAAERRRAEKARPRPRSGRATGGGVPGSPRISRCVSRRLVRSGCRRQAPQNPEDIFFAGFWRCRLFVRECDADVGEPGASSAAAVVTATAPPVYEMGARLRSNHRLEKGL